jgi:hypothetical protein
VTAVNVCEGYSAKATASISPMETRQRRCKILSVGRVLQHRGVSTTLAVCQVIDCPQKWHSCLFICQHARRPLLGTTEVLINSLTDSWRAAGPTGESSNTRPPERQNTSMSKQAEPTRKTEHTMPTTKLFMAITTEVDQGGYPTGTTRLSFESRAGGVSLELEPDQLWELYHMLRDHAEEATHAEIYGTEPNSTIGHITGLDALLEG